MDVKFGKNLSLRWYQFNKDKIVGEKESLPVIYKIYKEVEKIANIDVFKEDDLILELEDKILRLKKWAFEQLEQIDSDEFKSVKELFQAIDERDYVITMHEKVFDTLLSCTEINVVPSSLISKAEDLSNTVKNNKNVLPESFKLIFKIQSIEEVEQRGDIERVEKAFKKYLDDISDEEIKELSSRLADKVFDTKDDFNKYVLNIRKQIMKILDRRVDSGIGQDFGLYLKKLRNSKGFSLTQAGLESGVSVPYISRIEKGDRRKPSYSILRKLAIAYGVDPTDLVSKAERSIQEGNGEDNSLDTIDFTKNFTQVIYSNDFKIHNEKVQQQEKDLIIQLVEKACLTNEDEMKLNLEILEIVKQIRKDRMSSDRENRR